MENTQENELLQLIKTTREFPDNKVLKAKGVEDMFMSVMTGLKDAAIEKIKEKATGWIMNLLGMGPGPDPLEGIKKQLEEQAEELKKINSKIDDLQQLVLKAFNEILDDVQKGQYDAAVRGLNPVIAKITSRYERLLGLAKTGSPDTSKKSDVEKLAAEIISEIPEAFDAIHSTLVGTAAGEENLFDFWARLSFKNTGSIEAYEQKIFNQFMYYYGLQVKALMLVMEAYHLSKSPMAEYYFNLWTARLNGEILAYLKNAPRTTIKQQVDLVSNPVSILSYQNNVYYTSGELVQNPPNPKLTTLQKPNYSQISSVVPPDTMAVFHLMRKGDYAYLAALQQLGTSSYMTAWHFMKVKLGNTPNIEKVITCHSPGEGPVRFNFPAASVCNDTTMYAMFSDPNLNGFAFVAVDLATFEFASNKGGYAKHDQRGDLGDIGGNGGVMYNNYFYTTALLSGKGPKEYDKNQLFTIDLNTKTIVNELLLGSLHPFERVYSSIRQPMAIQDKFIYCCAGDTVLRVIDISNPVQPKVVATVDTGSYISEIHVDGALIYFTNYPGGSDIFGDDRGNINVAFFTSRTNNTVLFKSARVGDGIHTLGIGDHVVYAGSARGQSKMYVLTYGNDVSKNIIPVPDAVK
jgi:archaellum component FlaC